MKPVLVVAAVSVAFFFSTCYAKRPVPAKVPIVKVGKTEYRSPASQMGCVEAWDTDTKSLIWRRQIYVVRYQPKLERDVQDVFIKTVMLKDSSLYVTNENESEYELDLETLNVKVLKGALVETF